MAYGIKTPPEREALVIKFYQAGISRADIVERSGAPDGTIDRIVARNGLAKSRGRPPVSQELKTEIARLCEQGKSNAEIGIEVGATRNAVAGVLSRLGIKRPPNVSAESRSRCRAENARPKLTPAQANESRRVAGRAAAIAQNDRAVAQRGGERKPPKPELIHAVEAPTGSPPRNISLAELTLTTCRWPIGSAAGAEQRFCGRWCDESEPYCSTCVRERKPFVAPDKKAGAKALVHSLRMYIA